MHLRKLRTLGTDELCRPPRTISIIDDALIKIIVLIMMLCNVPVPVVMENTDLEVFLKLEYFFVAMHFIRESPCPDRNLWTIKINRVRVGLYMCS